MSGAFVKEIDGERWQAPAQPGRYRVHWAEDGEVLREGDDLGALLAWAVARPQGSFELRRADGVLLGQVG